MRLPTELLCFLLWTVCVAQVKPCDFPDIKHGGIYKEHYYKPNFPVSIGKYYRYYCDYGFMTSTSRSYWDYITCTEEGWKPAVPCVTLCDFRYLENGDYQTDRGIYEEGQSLKVQCYSGFSLPNGEDTVTCTENGWSPPLRCIRVNNSCVNPPEVENAAIVSGQKDQYQSGERVRYECHKPFEIFGVLEVLCWNGRWTEPPQCKDSTGKCKPPPPIANGDLTSFPLPEYPSGATVEYQCQSLYQLRGNKKITCRNGEWPEPPRCLNACVISEERMESNNLTLMWRERKKLYVPDGDEVEFRCKSGFRLAPGKRLRVVCHDGHLDYPYCWRNH